MADWNEIEAQYLTSQVSYRALAEQHGVSISTIKRRGKKYGWVEKRRRHADDIREKILEEDTENRVDRVAKLVNVADKLLERVEELGGAAEITPANLKTLSETLKNIRDAQMLKETNRTEADNQTIRVVLEGVKEFVS